MKPKRLVPERFKRIWSLAEFVATEPGATRRDLARRFCLSERQLQADLQVIRRDMRLPLVRAGGYRLAPGAVASERLTLQDAHTLFLVLQRASGEPSIPREALTPMAAKLAEAFPAHLQPLVRRTLAGGKGRTSGPGPELFASLTQALLRHQAVRLRFPSGAGLGYLTEPIMEPELLFPYQESWYLVGWCRQQQRLAMPCLDALQSVTFEP